VEGFKKASFFKKILPDTLYRIIGVGILSEVFMEWFGWRFFLKPAGLEFAFLNTWNLVLQSFLSIFILDKLSRLSWKGYKILKQKK